VAILQTRAGCQAEDGMAIYDGGQWVASDPGKLPGEAQLAGAVGRWAPGLTALTKAPHGEEPYAGPVLFEPRAAAQLVGEVWVAVCASRRPVAEPGRALPFRGERVRIAAEQPGAAGVAEVIDDPTAGGVGRAALAGHYVVDLEGVRPPEADGGREGRAEDAADGAAAGSGRGGFERAGAAAGRVGREDRGRAIY
jgi:hypothetical protein